MNLSFDHIFDKIEAHADKLGIAFGAYSQFKKYNPANPFEPPVTIINSLIQNPHLPNLQHLINALTNQSTPEGQTFMTGIQALIAGWLLKEIDIHSTLTKIGDFLFKAGIGISEASLVISTVAYSGAFNSPTYKPMGAGARVSNPFLDKSILGVN